MTALIIIMGCCGLGGGGRGGERLHGNAVAKGGRNGEETVGGGREG